MKPIIIFSQILRLLRLGILGRIGLALALLILVFHVAENWRGHRAWMKYVQEKTAQGLHLEWEACIPPQVPDEDNFAMTPLLAALYDFKPGTQESRDTNRSPMIERIIEDTRIDFLDGDWIKGQHTSLSRCLTNQLKRIDLRHMPPALLQRYQIDPDQENKALEASQKAISRYSTMEAREQAGEIMRLLGPLQPVWGELRDAVRRSHCRYPVKYDHKPIWEIATPHLVLITQLCSVLRLQIVCHLELGQTEAALADLELGFYLTNTLKADPSPDAYHARYLADHRLTHGIWEGASRNLWSPAQLERLQHLRKPINEIAQVREALLRDRALKIRTIEVAGRNFYRLDWSDFWSSVTSLPIIGSVLYSKCAPEGWFEWEKINLCRVYDELIPRLFILPEGIIATSEWSRLRTWWQSPRYEHPFLNHCALSGLVSPLHVELWVHQAARHQAAVALAYLGCALARYRLDHENWPPQLADLAPRYLHQLPVDAVTGESYRYRLNEEDHFILYSIGLDGVDNQGTFHHRRKQGLWDVDIDWIWTNRPRSAKSI